MELISIPKCLMTWFRLLYVYQSGVKNHPSVVQGLICQTLTLDQIMTSQMEHFVGKNWVRAVPIICEFGKS